MTGREFVRRVRRLARQHGLKVRLDPSAGKGDHGTPYLNGRKTIIRTCGRTSLAAHSTTCAGNCASIRGSCKGGRQRTVAYPARFTPEDENGFSVTFRDLPEANASGDDLEGTLQAAVYGLAVALEFRIRDDQPWSEPSRALEDERLITLPVLIEAKLALMRPMHETGTTKVELARRLGISEGAVRRLLRFDHRSHIGQIEAALERLGCRLELRLRRAA